MGNNTVMNKITIMRPYNVSIADYLKVLGSVIN